MTVDVTVTERAARRIGEILRTEPIGSMLRVRVEGGGCSGFEYKFDVERAKAAADLIGAAFKISNPNATASCGCGTSFSV